MVPSACPIRLVDLNNKVAGNSDSLCMPEEPVEPLDARLRPAIKNTHDLGCKTGESGSVTDADAKDLCACSQALGRGGSSTPASVKPRDPRSNDRKICLGKGPAKVLRILGGILALSGLFWTIYGLYHFSKPANSISEDGVQAAKWANYYSWVWAICPAEQVSDLLRAYIESAQIIPQARNITKSVPPPEKPQNFEIKTFSHLLARSLVPYALGSEDLDTLFRALDASCAPKSQLGPPDLPDLSVPCPVKMQPPPLSTAASTKLPLKFSESPKWSNYSSKESKASTSPIHRRAEIFEPAAMHFSAPEKGEDGSATLIWILFLELSTYASIHLFRKTLRLLKEQRDLPGFRTQNAAWVFLKFYCPGWSTH